IICHEKDRDIHQKEKQAKQGTIFQLNSTL
ncbi:unnamed protein product, partial [marine sediment metagenome]